MLGVIFTFKKYIPKRKKNSMRKQFSYRIYGVSLWNKETYYRNFDSDRILTKIRSGFKNL